MSAADWKSWSSEEWEQAENNATAFEQRLAAEILEMQPRWADIEECNVTAAMVHAALATHGLTLVLAP